MATQGDVCRWNVEEEKRVDGGRVRGDKVHNSSGCLGEDKTRPQTRHRRRNNARKAGQELRAEIWWPGSLAVRWTAREDTGEDEAPREKRRARLDVEMDRVWSVSVGVGF